MQSHADMHFGKDKIKASTNQLYCCIQNEAHVRQKQKNVEKDRQMCLPNDRYIINQK